jgi:hypothetical protein
MSFVFVQFGVSTPDDLHHAEDALVACADPIKQNIKFNSVSKIYFKIVPLDTKDFLLENAVEHVNTLLDALASVLSRSMDVFPDKTVEPCIPSAAVGFQNNADEQKVDFSHGQVSFAFLESIVVRNRHNATTCGQFFVVLTTIPHQAPQAPSLDFPNKLYRKVCMGGTFDRLHQGHKLLLIRAALSATEEAVVGVSAGDLVANKKWKEMLEHFELRLQNVVDFCNLQRKDLKWSA